jgi:hypothetical protein
MFRKSILKTAALAVITATVAATGVSTASAGGYGYGHGSYNKGHVVKKVIVNRPFAHIQDRIWHQHVDWCQGRFRTYNTYDNTYQPYSGPRAQCWSPYIAR